MVVTLRDAVLSDRQELRRLIADYLFEFDGTTERYPYLEAYWTEPERLPLLIEEDGETVGLCLVRRHDGEWSIAEFSVLPDRRRTGIGRAAVEALAARARVEGVAYLEATVHPGHGEALAFWLALGFSEVDRRGTDVTVTRRAVLTNML